MAESNKAVEKKKKQQEDQEKERVMWKRKGELNQEFRETKGF